MRRRRGARVYPRLLGRRVIDALGDRRPADTLVFCAGVDRDGDGRLVTAGGRVLSIVGFGPRSRWRERAYEGVRRVGFAGMQFRNDIAAAAAKEET